MADEKLCYSCNKTYPEYLFYISRGSKTGLSSWCRVCSRKRAKAKYAANPNAQNKARQLCKEWRANHKEWARFRHLLNTYHLTLDQYYAMEEAQDFVCAICKNECNLHVDHNHVTKENRGLLCGSCNMGLGNFKDSAANMQRACVYLEKKGSYAFV